MEIDTHELHSRLNDKEKAVLSVLSAWTVTLVYLTAIGFDTSVVGLLYIDVSGHLFGALYGIGLVVSLTAETKGPEQLSGAASNETIQLAVTGTLLAIVVILSLLNKNLSAVTFIYTAVWYTVHRGRQYRAVLAADS